MADRLAGMFPGIAWLTLTWHACHPSCQHVLLIAQKAIKTFGYCPETGLEEPEALQMVSGVMGKYMMREAKYQTGKTDSVGTCLALLPVDGNEESVVNF